jgi:hypothetical protein
MRDGDHARVRLPSTSFLALAWLTGEHAIIHANLYVQVL